MENVVPAIEQKFNTIEGKFALAFKDLTGNLGELCINAHDEYHAASTMKTPIMVEIFNMAAQGKINLFERRPIVNQFVSIVDGSGFELEPEEEDANIEENSAMTIYDLVYEMITVSSNWAANILLDIATPVQISQTMRELGIEDINILRCLGDFKAFDENRNNTTTAYALMKLYEVIALKKVVTKEACDQMLKILLNQKHRNVLPALLPPDVKVAHKTGWIVGAQHDSGIVFLPDGRKYVLVLLSQKMQDEQAGRQILAEVSQLVYKEYATA